MRLFEVRPGRLPVEGWELDKIGGRKPPVVLCGAVVLEVSEKRAKQQNLLQYLPLSHSPHTERLLAARLQRAAGTCTLWPVDQHEITGERRCGVRLVGWPQHTTAQVNEGSVEEVQDNEYVYMPTSAIPRIDVTPVAILHPGASLLVTQPKGTSPRMYRLEYHIVSTVKVEITLRPLQQYSIKVTKRL